MLERRASERHRTRFIPGEPRRVGGSGQERRARQPGDALGFGHPIPQLEHPLVLPARLLDGVHPLGLRARPHRGRQRRLDLAGCVPVVGDLGGDRGLSPRERRLHGELLGERGMKRGALAGDEIGVDRLAQERVPECVAETIADQHLLGDRLAQRSDQLAVLHHDERPEQSVVDRAAGDRRHADDLASTLREASQADEERVPQ